MPKPSNKNEFIAAGMRVMFRKGYHATGIRDVVAEGGVPQGSFTNHFGSKEAFAQEVLDHYFMQTQAIVEEALGDHSLSPRGRLLRYLDIITDRLAADGYLRGCLIGDFSIEVSQVSEPLRERLVAIYREWLRPFEECIAEGQKAGEIEDRFSPQDLADFLLTSWEGAILRMKVEQSEEPLERFKKIAFTRIFAKGS
ncbi:TetR family transcriptional regulator C-terminal domain-containing protein [Labrys sp. La1]|uniref:TetR/AcrR family transcriptional regulator n=1 Tax=Labrys sp. La1 TaxID=3404917 RepID=UPI003EBA117B